MRRYSLAVALAMIVSLPARATFWSPDSPVTLGGTTFLPWEVVDDSSGTNTVVLSLPPGMSIDGLHRMDVGDWLVSVGAPASLGGVPYDPRDVVRFDGAAYTLFFSGAAAGVPPGVDVDAVFLEGGDTGDLILSFDVPTTIAGAIYEPADLVRFSGGIFTVFFDASAATTPIPISTNVTAADQRAGSTLLAFDVPTTLGGTTYLPGQIAAWDGVGFSSAYLNPAWPLSAYLNGLSASACVDADGDGFGSPGEPSCPAGGAEDCDDGSFDVYPGAPQSCDGLNNDCSDPSWPALAGTNDGDDDADALSECGGDCDDANGTAWGTPGEVVGLTVIGSTLTWSPPLNPGGDVGFLLFDTIRSTVRNNFFTSPPATCVESDDGPNTTAVDTLSPPSGAVFYYVVRAQNACPGALGVGSLGTTSSGTPRLARDCP